MKLELKVRTVYVDAPWKAGGEYLLEIDSASVYDIYGHFNDKISKNFKVRTEEYYGKVMLTVKGVTGNTILQLYKSDTGKPENGKRKYSIVREKEIKGDGVVELSCCQRGNINSGLFWIPMEMVCGIRDCI
ncbi:MAG: hypothetical protein V8S95_00570 [Odoribacter sp.]